MILKTIPMSMRTKIHAMKKSIPLWVNRKVGGNWDSNIIRIPQWIKTQGFVTAKDRFKRARLRAWQWGVWIEKLIWVRSFKVETL